MHWIWYPLGGKKRGIISWLDTNMQNLNSKSLLYFLAIVQYKMNLIWANHNFSIIFTLSAEEDHFVSGEPQNVIFFQPEKKKCNLFLSLIWQSASFHVVSGYGEFFFFSLAVETGRGNSGLILTRLVFDLKPAICTSSMSIVMSQLHIYHWSHSNPAEQVYLVKITADTFKMASIRQCKNLLRC